MFPTETNPIEKPTEPESTIHKIFFGPDGLRAGWSLLLFVLPFFVLYGVGLAIRHSMHQPTEPTHAGGNQMTVSLTIVVELLCFAVVALISFMVSRVEGRPFGLYGLGTEDSPRRLTDFLLGLIWGAVFLSLLIAILSITHYIIITGIALRPARAVGYAFAWAVAFLFVGLFEEFFFRGFVQYTATRGISGLVRAISPANRHSHAIGFWLSTLIFSVGIFALVHTSNQGESPLGIAAVAAAGLTFAFSLWRTGTLWWAIGFHAAWDWAQSFLFGVADSGSRAQGHFLITHPNGSTLFSGGTTGPEGSLFVFPTLALAAFVIARTLPRRNYPLTLSQLPPVSARPEAFTLSEDASA